MVDTWLFDNLLEIKRRYKVEPLSFDDYDELCRWADFDNFRKEMVINFVKSNIDNFNAMIQKCIDEKLAEIISETKGEIKKMQEAVKHFETASDEESQKETIQ